MGLTEVALIASIISGVAVTISLVYLALQINQNTRHTRAQIQQARVTRLIDQMIGFSDADKCAAYIRGNGRDPTPEAIQDRQFYMQCIAQFGVILDGYTQHQEGLLNDEQFHAISATYRMWFREPGLQRHWHDWYESTAMPNSGYYDYVKSLLPADNT